MSTEIDNRIVSMQFNNRQFEQGVSTSLSTLDKLKKGLNLEGAAKGLEGISAAANRVSFGGMSNSIDAVKLQFSALQVMAVTALANITNSAVNAGKSLVKSLTIDPIKSGFNEYENKIKAAKTMMAGTGESLKVVSSALNDLNTYSDKTIYSFADMTANISKFTNAGLKSKEASQAIIGISNAAALAGATAEEAGRSMYNFGQAMSAGYVKNIDWKSIELANMGTIGFKNSLLEAAYNAGTLKKNSKGMYQTPKGTTISATKEFTASLEQGWMTTAVLSKTLKDYGDETTAIGKKAFAAAKEINSGTQLLDIMRESVAGSWTTTWEMLIGNAGEAKKLWTSVSSVISPIIAAAGEARNKLLSEWRDLGGRTVLIEGLGLAFKNLINIGKSISSAFKEIFPPTTAKQLFALTTGFKKLMAGMVLSKGSLDNIKSTFKGLFAVIDIGLDIFKFVASALGLIVKAIFPVTGGVLAVTGGFGDFLVMIHDVIERSNVFGIALKGIGKAINIVSSILSPYIEKLKTWVKTSTLIEDSINKIKKVFGPYIASLKEFVKTSTLLEDGISGIQNGLAAATGGLRPVLTFVKNIFKDFSKFVKEIFTGTTVFATTLDNTKKVFSDAASGANKLTSSFSKLGGVLSAIKTGVVNVATKIKNVLTPVFEFIKEKISGITMTDVGAVFAGGGFLMFANMLRKGLNGINDITENFANVLGEVGNSLKAFQMQVKAKALLTIAMALGILTLSLIALTFIDMKDLAKSLGIITIVLAELIGSMILLNKFGGSNKKIWEKGNISGIIGLGLAMLLLAGAVKILASIDKAGLEQATKALSKIMLTLVIFIQATRGGNLKKSAGGLIAFSIGILILTKALTTLSQLKPEVLKQGMDAIIDLMLAIGVFIMATKAGDLKQSAGGLIAFSIGILILTKALTTLGQLKPEVLEQGSKALTKLMFAIAIFVMGTNGGDLRKSAGGLIAFSIGIAILVKSLTTLGQLKPEVLMQGGKAIVDLMLAIGFFIAGTNGGDLRKSAGGLIAFSIGILILSKSLTTLGKLEPEVLKQGGKAIMGLLFAIRVFIMGTRGGDLAASSAGMIAFAFGLTILAGAVKILGTIAPDRIIESVKAMVILIGAIAIFIEITKGGDLIASSAGMIAFAFGLTILAGAVAILAHINPDRIIQGVGALAILIATIGFFVKATSGSDLIVTGEGLKLFAMGILILAGSLAILSALNPQKLLMASGAMSTVILSLGLFINMTKGSKLVAACAALIVFAIAIDKIVVSLIKLAKMDTNAIIAASASISILLLTIAAFTKLTNGKDLVVSSIGLVAFSGALMVLTLAVKMLGELPMMTIIKGVGGLVVMLIAIGLTSVILAPLAPAILVLAGAMAIFGLGCLSVAVATFVFANALTILSQTGAAGANVLVEVVRKMVALIPEIMQTIALGVIQFAETIGNGAPVIAAAFLKVLTAILDTIILATPKIMECVRVLIMSFLNFLVSAIPQMINAGTNLVVGILNGIAANIGRVINAAFNLIIKFINGLANAIRNNQEAINNAMANLITAIVGAVIGLSVKLVNVGIQVVKDILKGIGQMHKAMFDAGVNAVKGFLNGLASMPGKILNAGADIARGALNAAKKELDERSPSKAFKKIGAFGGEGFVIGLLGYVGKASSAAKNVGRGAIDAMSNAIAGISDVVTNDINAEPVIRPVMDLSNIQNGSKQLYNMMGKMDGYAVNGSIKTANSTARSIQNHKIESDEINSIADNALTQQSDINQPARPVTLQLMLQNGRAIAEFIVDDLDNLIGTKNNIVGRTVGV